MTIKYLSFRQIMLVAILVLQISVLFWENAIAQTRLGLHVTQEELAIWKQRAQSGPYKTLSDVSTNSPGDWDRIVVKAEWFRLNPTDGIELGPDGNCENNDFIAPLHANQTIARKMRDAAFYALIKEDADLKVKVRDWILTQSSVENLDFTNTAKWCIGSNIHPEGSWGYGQWLKVIMFAMDYIEILDPNVFTSGQQSDLEDWFVAYAEMSYKNINFGFNSVFVDRPNGDYTPVYGDSRNDIAYYGSIGISSYGKYWNNRRGDVMSLVATVGVKYGDNDLIFEGKRYAKETVRFGVFPDGFVTDFDRWTASIPDLGWQYSHANMGHQITTADVTARDGDTEVYDYLTSDGLYGSDGGPKDLLFAMQSLAKYVDHTYDEYGTDQASRDGDPDYRIDGRYANGNQNPGLISMVHGNVYYKDPYFKSVYMRKAPGTVPYPGKYQVISNGPHSPWQGASAIYPGVLFMFGDMGGKVWPYPGKDLLAPVAPTNLSIVKVTQ